eukprot:TRINITY_DN36804_c0_g1_i1.p1 TRINITY_DN36804_c0_g1~~TRINITY_DN36804_c0_g1_i1.p1  ORF type:complete len:1197 (+),score=244.75 TRINITY_DN36804_c0_g1_i1:67-3657(+)
MDALIKNFFDKKVGDFLQVDAGNLHVDPASGQLLLKKASFKSDVFDGLHLPVTLKGGFIDEMSFNLELGVFSSGGTAKVTIKNVFFVLGPHVTDWSYNHVLACKTKLVDLIQKILDLKPKKKKKKVKAADANGWMQDVQTKIKQDMMKKIAEMIEVQVSNIHFRFEDAVTQSVPFACGFKIGYIAVSSNEDNSRQRTTGTWRHTVEPLADPLFCQSISARRLSVYWDIDRGRQHFASKPVSGKDVYENFRKLNLRETFSACVVEKILEVIPPTHQKRIRMEGPTFRDRLDFHQYIVFPTGLSAHVTANRTNDATKLQKAPLKDADVIVYSVDVALDSEQLRSLNSLLSHVKNFTLKDKMSLSRPSASILSARPERRREVVAAWWQHAFKCVTLICKIPKKPLCSKDLREKTAQKEKYVGLVMDMRKAEAASGGKLDEKSREVALVRSMQMTLPLKEILDWRTLAKERMDGQQEQTRVSVQQQAVHDMKEEKAQGGYMHLENEEDSDHDFETDSQRERRQRNRATSIARPMPDTLQAKVNFQGFQVFFLASQRGFWTAPTKKGNIVDREELDDDREHKLRRLPMKMRQPVLIAKVMNVRAEAIQKGHKLFRIARWVELTVGSISVINCNARPSQQCRNIVSIKPFHKQNGVPVCMFVGATTFQLMDRTTETGDTPISAVLEPWDGIAGHLKDTTAPETPAMLSRLGFLKEYINDIGKLMIFAFTRVGEVRAVDWTPFRRRMLYFVKRGKEDISTTLVRRPSPEAIDKELMIKLQKGVQAAVGKSNMLGLFEGELEGVNARTVDNYNSLQVLCKQAQLAPLRWRVLRSGLPQALQLQFHNLHRGDGFSSPSLSMLTGEGGFSLLPWKASMFLLPQEDFLGTAGKDKAKKITKVKKKASGKVGKQIEEEFTPGSIEIRERQLEADGSFHLSRDNSLKGGLPRHSSNPSMRSHLKEEHAHHLPPLESCWWIKWGRSGLPKLRWVEWDDNLKVIKWKQQQNDVNPIGILPVWRIQDVVVGAQTEVVNQAATTKPPFLAKAFGSCLRSVPSNVKLDSNLILSIVGDERTLDLQAESIEQQVYWANGLKARFREHVQTHGSGDVVASDLPAEIAKKYKPYPEKYRTHLCELRSSCEKLHAIKSFGNALEVMKEMAVSPPEACSNCKALVMADALHCPRCGAAREVRTKTDDLEIPRVEHVSIS